MRGTPLSRRAFIAGSATLLHSTTGFTNPAADDVDVTSDADALHVKAGGRPVLDFRLRPQAPSANIRTAFLRAGYLHPVYTPSGRIVTGDYPEDHPHQHGIFFAWTKTEFEGRHPDFWNMGDGTGTVELERVENAKGGAEKGGFHARLRHVDLSGSTRKTALDEVWEVTVYQPGSAAGRYFIFDIVSTQRCASTSPLLLPEYRYGGIGIRGNPEWRAKSNVSFLTSEGKDRIAGDDTSARWLAMSGRVDNQTAGLAALCHPSNFRAPQPLRIHPDDPYFNFAPSRRGPWEIVPGKPYISRYRFVAYDGELRPAELESLWNAYAKE